MDAVVESVANEVGPRWMQLYARLGLDHRGRYHIDVTHSSDPEGDKHRNCAVDTLKKWRQSVGGVEEKEALKQLFSVLSKINGCESLAERLCAENGIVLDPPTPPQPKPDPPHPPQEDFPQKTLPAKQPFTSSSSSSSSPLTVARQPSQNPSHVATKQTSTAQRQPSTTARHTARQPSTREKQPSTTPARPLEASRQSSTTHRQPPSKKSRQPLSRADPPSSRQPVAQEPPTLGNSDTESDLDSDEFERSRRLPAIEVHLHNRAHKFAILDIAQRLPQDHRKFKAISEHLGVSSELADQIRREEPLQEEQYYQVLKLWATRGEGEANFSHLEEVLHKFSQDGLVAFIHKRLKE